MFFNIEADPGEGHRGEMTPSEPYLGSQKIMYENILKTSLNTLYCGGNLRKTEHPDFTTTLPHSPSDIDVI